MSASHGILLTPPGAAAIAVVRITGPRVKPFLSAHFSRPAAAGRAVHGHLRHAERVLDDPVVVLHAGAADMNLHGGPWVVASVLEFLRSEGFELISAPDDALPDEAVDAESEIWREVLTHLPLARTEQALRVLLAQPSAWGRGERPKLEDQSLYWLLHPPRVAIVGPPNVGKSTLANQLFAQERSITADLPGTTRDWVGEMANLDGLAVMLVDTPGLRATSDAIERAAIERSGAEVKRADLVVLVLDASAPLGAEERRLIDAHPGGIVVWNKSDRAGNRETAAGICTVAISGQGVDELRRAIRRRFGSDRFDETRPRWWTERQQQALS
ncbi:MAG TPA: GTPase [Tepidisphaeraceae bacterium]|nr:GTPase [Tepidisphaeraceae bacterium]